MLYELLLGERGFNRGLVRSKLPGGVCWAGGCGSREGVAFLGLRRAGVVTLIREGRPQRTANGPVLQLGAIKPDRCMGGTVGQKGVGRGEIPSSI